MGANSCRTGAQGDGERLALKVVTVTTPVAFFSHLDVMQLSNARVGELAWRTTGVATAGALGAGRNRVQTGRTLSARGIR